MRVNTIAIAQFKGQSFISKCIKWITRSQYSHSAFLINDSLCAEMWGGEGLRLEPSLSTGHCKGTIVDIYSLDPPLSADQIDRLILSIKKDLDRVSHIKYDTFHVLAFLPVARLLFGEIRQDNNSRRMFCSELVCRKLEEVGCKLLNQDPFKISPGDVATSLRLKYSYSVITQ